MKFSTRRRKNVSSRSVVGKTLNSTGLVIYIETSSTTTEIVMLELISMSSRNAGSGMIMASTTPRTAKGTLSSAKVPMPPAKRLGEAATGLRFGPFERGGVALLGPPAVGAEMGPICAGAAI